MSISHDSSAPELALHFAWTFLAFPDMQIDRTLFPIMGAYARLRLFVSSLPPSEWQSLSSMGPIQGASLFLSRGKAYLLAATLLVLNFFVGDLLR